MINMDKTKVSFIDVEGQRQQISLAPELYKAAADNNMTVRQYINHKYPSASDAKHDTFVQLCASAGLHFKQDKSLGVNSAPLKVVLDSPVSHEAGAITSNVNPVQSRILFPAAVLEYVESKMAVDRTSVVTAFDRTVALTTTVPNARIEQPVINYTGKDGPEDSRAQVTSQLARPPAMLSITTSDVTQKIPTKSLGILVSDEALQSTTLDLVGLALQRQMEVEGYSLAAEALIDMLSGDVDNGQSALAQTKANTLDTAIVAAGALTQTAWIKWLYTNLQSRRIDWVFTDIAGAMAIENRTGKPNISGDDPNSPRIDTIFNIAFPQLVKNVQMFIVPSDWGWTANTIMGIQSNSAIHKYVNSSASYSAMERFALQKGQGLRFDFGSLYARLFDDAFSVLSLTT
jgi:hypothetical protein